MKIDKHLSFLLIILAVFSIRSVAEDEKTAATAPTLEIFSSFVGHWRGEGLGGVCEETWLPASGGSMSGIFKFIQNDKVRFYELMTLILDSLGPAIRVKHFNADMTSWEDKTKMVTFRFDSTSGNQFFFEGQTYMRPSPDSLRIVLSIKQTDGTISEEKFEFKRFDF